MSWYRVQEFDILRVGELILQQGITSTYPSAGTVLYTNGQGGTFWSTAGAGGGSGTITDSNLTSTIQGLGTFGYISSTQLFSTVSGLGRGGGGGSTLSSLYVGSSSNQNFIKFWGRQGEYNNAAIIEQSTGGITGEILTFKGSSVSDQLRFQTTGAIRFEAGATTRDINSASQFLTPTMIINSSSNIGILTNNPSYTLDVTGTGRFTTLLSTASLYTGAIYTGIYFA